MSQTLEPNTKAPTLEELYPELNEEQLKEARENLDRFALLLWRIAKRLASDPVALAEYKRLTGGAKDDKTEIGRLDDQGRE